VLGEGTILARHTNLVIESYDFSEALSWSVDERISRSLEVAARLVEENGYQGVSDFPCIPVTGATDKELDQLEIQLGVHLPHEYRVFLSRCRYLKIDDGIEIGGLDCEGTYVTERPWVSDTHRPSVRYLVFANYWRFADGDQLMFDLSSLNQPVIAYLHEHGPLFELYAPSFSLALWRLVQESTQRTN